MENLTYKKRNFYEAIPEKIDAACDYAVGYADFITKCKTERESVIESVKMAEAAGYVPYSFGMEMNPGDKFYYNNRGKSLFLFRIGTEDINNGIRISAAHIDSPRLDLKQVPLFEDGGFAYLKTHYYGGIRKYQWVTVPLALHGVVVKTNGDVVDVVIGEDESDPVLYISDLLPHLGGEQSKKPLGEAIPGEKLNLIVGSRPVDGDIKTNVLKILNEKYGIIEEDFLSAELSAVPAGVARDMGLDRSLIAAYGHDDRCCSYPALTSLIGCDDDRHTLMCVLVDKEETGSDGVSGMQSMIMSDLIEAIANARGGSFAAVRASSKCLSADVSAAYDPSFPEVFEKNNAALINCGTVLSKYTGARGKSGTSDASAEYLAWLRRVMEEYNVVWQTAELGKIDAGGGGTVAKFVANLNIDTVDLGIPVLSMHAPIEVIAKSDLYEAYRAFDAFCRY